MPDQPNTPQSNSPAQTPDAAGQDPEKLAQQVANRVWELWREELRHDGERRGVRRGG